MKKLVCIYCLLCLLDTVAFAQLKKEIKETQKKNKSNVVSLGLTIPIGSFSDTHKYGAAIEYSWSNHRFGLMKKIPVKRIGFIANSGINYYLGKKEMISSYEYKYRNFTYIYAYAGAICNAWKKGNIHLTVGPATGIEDGIVEFWWGANLSGSYYVNEKIAITPGISFVKRSIADPLLAVSLRATMAF